MTNDDCFKITVTCASGVEKVTKKELFRLGYGDAPAVNGSITFDGDYSAVARCNLNLRTADRVYINLAEFPATTFDELFDGVSGIYWENYIPADGNIIVNGKCVKSKLFAISACQSVIKKAIANRLMRKYRQNSLLETGADYEIAFSVFKDTVTVMLNTSGQGLHKRGYRDMVGIAPIRETLASALLMLGNYYPDKPLADPFCGSGTILIEGARLALNIAPGRDRQFAFNYWKNFDKKYYKLALDEAISNEKPDRKLDVLGSDIDSKAIKLATRHIERAGVSGKIKLSCRGVKDFTTDLKDGVIVTNPPYGIRVYDKKEAEACYRELGEAYRKLENWSLFAITAANNFERYFGKKCDRERKLYNSNTECRFYQYYSKKDNV